MSSVQNNAHNFAVLCAAHVTTDHQLRALRQMMESHDLNLRHFPLHVSFSGDKNLFERLRKDRTNKEFKVYYSDQQLKQFRHFARLSDLVESDWYLFSDADDLVSPQRNETFYQCRESVMTKHIQTHAIFYLDYKKQKQVMNSGWPDTWDAIKPCMVDKDDRGFEIWKCATRRETLRRFVRDCDPGILDKTYCDMFFCRVMQSNGSSTSKTVVSKFGPGLEPVYFQRSSPLLNHMRTHVDGIGNASALKCFDRDYDTLTEQDILLPCTRDMELAAFGGLCFEEQRKHFNKVRKICEAVLRKKKNDGISWADSALENLGKTVQRLENMPEIMPYVPPEALEGAVYGSSPLPARVPPASASRLCRGFFD